MTTALRRPEPITIEAFDKFVEAQPDDSALFELVDGVIIMMTNPTQAHERIVTNIAGPLIPAMDARGCDVFFGNMRVQRSDDRRETDKTKPDVVVRCGALGTTNYITDPLVVIEVLSPSTMDTDRGPKLDFYKSLPTVRHIVLVYQDEMRVEHYRRGEQGFEHDVLKRSEEALHLEAIDFRIDLARIYFRVTL
jgi:Uma2 family endonuclease